MNKRGGGGREAVSQFCFENLLSQGAERLRVGNHLCFKKILVSSLFLDRGGSGKEYHAFLSKICCLTVKRTS